MQDFWRFSRTKFVFTTRQTKTTPLFPQELVVRGGNHIMRGFQFLRRRLYRRLCIIPLLAENSSQPILYGAHKCLHCTQFERREPTHLVRQILYAMRKPRQSPVHHLHRRHPPIIIVDYRVAVDVTASITECCVCMERERTKKGAPGLAARQGWPLRALRSALFGGLRGLIHKNDRYTAERGLPRHLSFNAAVFACTLWKALWFTPLRRHSSLGVFKLFGYHPDRRIILAKHSEGRRNIHRLQFLL